LIVLGIETSCDETAAAVCQDKKIISSQISTQTIHRKYGGVVPEIASREHEKLLNDMVSDTLEVGGISKNQLKGIAVTQGPGLAGALITGVCFAKGLALGLGLPIIGINHLEAHIFVNFLADPTLNFPFICLLVSGGHTQLWYVKDLNHYTLMGETRDDAVGEAFDKGARILGLGYPGGPEIEKLAEDGNTNAIKFPRAFMGKNNMEFSFSGLKTALLYYMDNQKNVNLNDIEMTTNNRDAYAVKMQSAHPEYVILNNQLDEAKVFKKLLATFPNSEVKITSKADNGDFYVALVSSEAKAETLYLFNNKENKISVLFQLKAS